MRVLVQQAFYQHDNLGPGAPLVEITGQDDGDGYYDWVGRRLFLTDGEPDPMCPGAYRYQHNPAACDLEAPDSDPRSPRYEPMHLRHKPGDTWIIDTHRPHDPFDPGPYGTPGWYKDERTGRHRRDETPDPLPAQDWVPPKDAWFPGTADWPEPRAAQDDPAREGRRDRPRTGNSESVDRPRTSGGRGGAERPPPWGSRGRPVPSEPDEPEQPKERSRFWPDDDEDPRAGSGHYRSSGDRGWTSGACDTPAAGDDLEGEGPEAHRFSKLREDAFERFIANSAQLRAAHFQPERPYLRERALWVLRWLWWVLACGLAPMPEPLTSRQLGREPEAPQAIPAPRSPSTACVERRPEDQSSTDARPESEAWVPGAAIAAAIGGARAARKTIADRTTRTRTDLAAAVRNSAQSARRTVHAYRTEPAAAYWRTQPRQNRPRPSARPAVSYMSAWEHAFDHGHALILGTGGAA